ncbi:tRNA (adenosine(37)-N6)-dimethylallyltransferase MiaA [Anatilimnocola floriformis]|uniref:tRNA (adenosine(37)-N6)-dimethylallyltransferase MiaA n=1 Tax=Anatilimnocola floriformis TaxID=2948575 RepID=UPI0020C4B43A|nr:tRNA (adenosine(37)-N6)-dimethylallyltransferase MiaA [Anatilimnocola floriformis]
MNLPEHDPIPVSPLPPVRDAWFLTGPTAAGKTKVGVQLARRLDAEIISIDSMAVYQGMDIGTAKPSEEERAAVPHHLLDVASPRDEYSLSEYLDAAHTAVDEIRSRGKRVLFVGGTPLYLKSLLRGAYQGPPADWAFREQIEKELAEVGLEALHERLQVIDPLLAAKLHPRDKRRIVRALEVFRLTGQPLSHQQYQFDDAKSAAESHVFVLQWPREILHQRIEARVDQMFAAGLVEEVKSLIAQHGSLSRTANQAVGYREVLEFLKLIPSERDRPPVSIGQCIDFVKIRTRQFAKRQETWFRSLSECTPVALDVDHSPAQVAEQIAALRGIS